MRLEFFNATVEAIDRVKHLIVLTLVVKHFFFVPLHLLQEVFLFGSEFFIGGKRIVQLSFDAISGGDCADGKLFFAFILLSKVFDFGCQSCKLIVGLSRSV